MALEIPQTVFALCKVVWSVGQMGSVAATYVLTVYEMEEDATQAARERNEKEGNATVEFAIKRVPFVRAA